LVALQKIKVRQIDVRKAWLEETALTSTKSLSRINNKSASGAVTTLAEKELAKVSAAYLYLLNLCDEYELLDERDPFNLFKDELIH
jgi:hypothetical protein